MELKHARALATSSSESCLNRTFMELKRRKRQAQRGSRQVLIVPLWN